MSAGDAGSDVNDEIDVDHVVEHRDSIIKDSKIMLNPFSSGGDDDIIADAKIDVDRGEGFVDGVKDYEI